MTSPPIMSDKMVEKTTSNFGKREVSIEKLEERWGDQSLVGLLLIAL